MAREFLQSLVGAKRPMPDGTLGAGVRAVAVWVLPGILTYTGTEGAAQARVLDFSEGSVFSYGFGCV